MIEPDTSGGKILCFTVPSRSQPGVLRHVDLCDDSCDCEDYLWRKSEAVGLSKEERRCWHLRQARKGIAQIMLPQIVDSDFLTEVILKSAKQLGRKFE